MRQWLNDWGGVLNVVALLSVLPLGYLSHILNPKIQEWWSARSTAALETLIQRKEYELMCASEEELLTPFQVVVLASFQSLFLIIRNVCLVAAMMYATVWRKELSVAAQVNLVGLLALSAQVVTYALGRIDRQLDYGSSTFRKKLKESLQEWKARSARSHDQRS